MMVETILESSQDFGMSNGGLPQWKRELLQRRAARSRPVAPPAPPALPPASPAAPPDDDEELRYGPGIVKRLKSRYLSLALREAPRRRPSVLRRAASLEHLLDPRPPPAPRARTRPVSLAAPAPAPHVPRRDAVKRARSVDALSRLDARDEPEPAPAPACSAPACSAPACPAPPPPPPTPPPPLPRSARPPRRPTPLLRATERPPPDVVRSTLRKFESAPTRRPAPAARVSAVLRGLEALPRSSTPEPCARSPSPAAADLSAIDEPEGAVAARPVSRAALEGIARAGSSVRYAFEAPRAGSHLPPLAAANPVLLGRARLSASPRRVGVIRPMPAPTLERSVSTPIPLPNDVDEKREDPTQISPPPMTYENESPPTPRQERKEPPPSAFVEPIPRPPMNGNEERSPSPIHTEIPETIISREVTPEPEIKTSVETETLAPSLVDPKPLTNGHAAHDKPVEAKSKGAFSRITAAGIDRAWTGAIEKKCTSEKKMDSEVKSAVTPPWARAGGRLRAGAPAATSVVFNFSARRDVPDYIENDGIVLRTSRRNRFKAGESGVVVLRADALAGSESEEEGEAEARPPSPCRVRFVNDNVLINGRSSMAARALPERAGKLKLQFDDSLTRTFEYPSETSLCEDAPAPSPAPTPACAPASAPVGLAANTHLVSAALAHYTPSKTLADDYPLGVARRPDTYTESERLSCGGPEAEAGAGAGAGAEAGDARPCAAETARSWSEARTHHTDLLF